MQLKSHTMADAPASNNEGNGNLAPLNANTELDPNVFASLAAVMAADEDISAFRRFDELNILNLLTLQDELQQLSQEFKTLCPPPKPIETQLGNEGRGWLASYRLGRHSPAPNEPESQIRARKKAWESLRGKLREYSSSHFVDIIPDPTTEIPGRGGGLGS